jgi:hypothetical protein
MPGFLCVQPSIKETWFHTGGPIRTPGGTWYDPQGQKEGAPASGLGHDVPGIATPGRAGLGEWFKVTTPDGRVVYTQKTDIGPGRGAQRRGVGLDVNAPLSKDLFPGGPGTFQQRGWQVERVGPKLPEGITPGIQPPQQAGGERPPPMTAIPPRIPGVQQPPGVAPLGPTGMEGVPPAGGSIEAGAPPQSYNYFQKLGLRGPMQKINLLRLKRLMAKSERILKQQQMYAASSLN